MSRTHKTDPYWVQGLRSKHRTIYHGPHCEFRSQRSGFSGGGSPCDVDEPRTSDGRSWMKCQYEPDDYWNARHIFGESAPRWYRQNVWENPKRIEERDKLGEAVKQYNGSGDTDDIVFEHINHRHCADWHWN